MKRPMIDTMQREKFDDLFTPEQALDPILALVKTAHPKQSPIIWECSDPGNSIISSVFREQGYRVVSTDITGKGEHYFDFIYDDPPPEFDIIVSNPPYSKKDFFLRRCFEMGKPFALLLPLTSLEGVYRGKMFRKYGISCIVFDRRLDFTGKKRNWFNTSWFHRGFYTDTNKITFWATKK